MSTLLESPSSREEAEKSADQRRLADRLSHRLTLLPSVWGLSLWCLWWLWRYGGEQALPSYSQLPGPAALGYLVDALLLDGLLALLRWRAGDGELRGAARVEAAHRLGPAWLRHLVIGTLGLSALLRAVDGLHAYLAHRHLDATFVATLLAPAQLWQLRYLWLAVLATAWAARVLVLRDLRQAARVRGRMTAEQASSLVHREALRAALGGCVGLWLAAAIGGAARALVAPPEWWTLGGLWEWLFG